MGITERPTLVVGVDFGTTFSGQVIYSLQTLEIKLKTKGLPGDSKIAPMMSTSFRAGQAAGMVGRGVSQTKEKLLILASYESKSTDCLFVRRQRGEVGIPGRPECLPRQGAAAHSRCQAPAG